MVREAPAARIEQSERAGGRRFPDQDPLTDFQVSFRFQTPEFGIAGFFVDTERQETAVSSAVSIIRVKVFCRSSALELSPVTRLSETVSRVSASRLYLAARV